MEESQIVNETPPETSSENPFREIRFLTIIPFMAAALPVAFAVFGLLHVTGVLPLSDVSAGMSLLTAWMYGGMLGWCLWQCRRHGIPLMRLFARPQGGGPFWRTTLIVAPPLLTSTGLMLMLLGAVSLALPEAVSHYTSASGTLLESSGSKYPGVYYVNLAFSFLILAPLVEEVLFRGFLLNRWMVRFGATRGILLTSFVFALLHVSQPGTFFFGLIAAMMYIKTRSLWVPIWLHFVNNLAAIALQFGACALSDTGGEAISAGDMHIAGLLGIPCLLVGIILMIAAIRQHWPDKSIVPPYFQEDSRENQEQLSE